MKIGYLLHWNASPSSGVWKKVSGQVTTWKEAGNDVVVHLVTTLEDYVLLAQELPWLSVYIYSSFPARLKALDDASRDLVKKRVDVVYLRHDIFYPSLYFLTKRKPVIVEINTNDKVEYCLRRNIRCIFHRLTRPMTFHLVDGVVSVSYELINTLPSQVTRSKPIEVIGNGINLDNIKPFPAPDNPVPHLVFLGSEGQVWHGVDKIVLLARAFPNWHFDIVGPRLEGMEVPPNVTLHGFLPHPLYESLVAHADVGIGTLALHRNRMSEASPLKTREYLAYGLPVIIGYKDTDFPAPPPFLLELPNCENNVLENLDKIERFVLSWKGKRVARRDISHLDHSVKESKRLEFMKLVMGRRVKRLGG